MTAFLDSSSFLKINVLSFAVLKSEQWLQECCSDGICYFNRGNYYVHSGGHTSKEMLSRDFIDRNLKRQVRRTSSKCIFHWTTLCSSPCSLCPVNSKFLSSQASEKTKVICFYVNNCSCTLGGFQFFIKYMSISCCLH